MPRSNYSSEAAYKASKKRKSDRRKDVEDAYNKSMSKGKKYGGSNQGGASIGGAA